MDWPRAQRIATARLRLEPLRPGHADEMAAVLADPELYVYTGGAPPSRVELARRYERQARGTSPDGTQGWLNWVLRLRSAGRLAGFVQATVTAPDGALAADLAWVVGAPDQGVGLGGEAAAAAAAWLTKAGVTTLTAHIHPANVPSAAVARRLGLEPGRVLDDGETLWSSPPGRTDALSARCRD